MERGGLGARIRSGLPLTGCGTAEVKTRCPARKARPRNCALSGASLLRASYRTTSSSQIGSGPDSRALARPWAEAIVNPPEISEPVEASMPSGYFV
jgi:hypothetical protein